VSTGRHLDVKTDQIQAFFDGPVDHMRADQPRVRLHRHKIRTTTWCGSPDSAACVSLR